MSFISLPPALRVKVYKELLCPIPREHDLPFAPSLRSYNTTAKLHPSILRVSKQVYLEACLVLYTSNTLILDLRKRFGNVLPMNTTQWSSTSTGQRLRLKKGGVYQQGLQRVRHVKIKVDEQAISTGLVTARRFTPGEVVVPQEPAASRILTSLLACLGAKSDWEEVEMSKRKTLKLGFVIEQDQHGWHELRNFLKGDHDDVRSEMMSFLILAKGVEKRRNVEVDLELMHKGDSRGKISLLELDLDLGSRWGRRWRG